MYLVFFICTASSFFEYGHDGATKAVWSFYQNALKTRLQNKNGANESMVCRYSSFL